MDPSSIFRPQSPVYTSIDNVNHDPRSPFPPNSPSFETAENDPFATASSRPLSSPPPESATSNSQIAFPTNGAIPQPPPRLTDDDNLLRDSKSPFHPEPLDSIFLSTPLGGLPSALLSPPLLRESHSAAPHSRRIPPPPDLTQKALGEGNASAISGSTSGIGNRSLMGLLGGTRYEARDFDSIGTDDHGGERDSVSVAESRNRGGLLFAQFTLAPADAN